VTVVQRMSAAIAVFLAGAAGLAQELPLVVRDNTHTVLGGLFQINAVSYSDLVKLDLMLYRYGASDYVFIYVSANLMEGIRHDDLYFENDSCTGQAWVEIDKRFQVGRPYPVGVLHHSDTLYRVGPGANYNSNQLYYRINSQGECDNSWTPGASYLPAFPVGPFPTFQPPLYYEINPSIFWDGFQTGDLSRWSNP